MDYALTRTAKPFSVSRCTDDGSFDSLCWWWCASVNRQRKHQYGALTLPPSRHLSVSKRTGCPCPHQSSSRHHIAIEPCDASSSNVKMRRSGRLLPFPGYVESCSSPLALRLYGDHACIQTPHSSDVRLGMALAFTVHAREDFACTPPATSSPDADGRGRGPALCSQCCGTSTTHALRPRDRSEQSTVPASCRPVA
jgi:hypothetical protein